MKEKQKKGKKKRKKGKKNGKINGLKKGGWGRKSKERGGNKSKTVELYTPLLNSMAVYILIHFFGSQCFGVVDGLTRSMFSNM